MTDTAAITVTLGACDEMRAEVLVRLDHPGGIAGQLVGTVSGPRRRRDTTLPTTTRLVPVAGDVGLWRAVLTEPAYWTPQLPNLYRLEARVGGAAGPKATIDAVIGLRRLGVRGRSFWLDGHRWVPRAVADAARVGEIADLAAARAANLVVATARPSAELLAAADEAGVAVMAVLDPEELSVAGIAALALHPSVVLAVVTGAGAAAVLDALPAAVRAAKGTLQLGLAVDGGRPPEPGGVAFDFLAVTLPAGGVPHEAWRRFPACPLVAWRRDAAAGRVACDAVQRDLAAWGMAGGGDHLSWDWAGYVVG